LKEVRAPELQLRCARQDGSETNHVTQ